VLVHGADEDTVFEAAIEAGADDVQPVFDEEGKPTNDFKVTNCTAELTAAFGNFPSSSLGRSNSAFAMPAVHNRLGRVETR
jgi:transcriptional/translational regulatory protein YebC/TACO1